MKWMVVWAQVRGYEFYSSVTVFVYLSIREMVFQCAICDDIPVQELK